MEMQVSKLGSGTSEEDVVVIDEKTLVATRRSFNAVDGVSHLLAIRPSHRASKLSTNMNTTRIKEAAQAS